MRISVVTVCYNSAATIEETMLSVLGQTHPDVEYIIIDGGSTDGTVDIIRKYADRLAYWVSEPDRGIYDAMNKGIAAATGDYINFMNAGDTFATAQAVERLVQGIDFSDDYIAGVFGKTIEKFSDGYRADDFHQEFMPFCHQSVIVRSDLMNKYGFDTAFKIFADRDFFRKIWSEGYRYHKVNEYITIFDTSGVSSEFQTKPYFMEFKKVDGSTPSELQYKTFIIKRRLAKLFKRFVPNIIIDLLKGVPKGTTAESLVHYPLSHFLSQN